MNDLLAKQRHTKILEIVRAAGVARTAELVRELHTSSETIRKDLEYLDKRGCLSRVHGGAVARTGVPDAGETGYRTYIRFEEREIQNQQSKSAIACRAADFVKEGQSVALDSGTSSYELAKVLKQRFTALTIVTNSLKIAVELVENPGFTVIATGGVLTADEHSFISDFASLILEHINIDIMFLSTLGISLAGGITDQRLSEVRIHNKMRTISRQVIVLADSSKFGNASLIRVCELADVDFIITDSDVDPAFMRQFAEVGSRLIVAGAAQG